MQARDILKEMAKISFQGLYDAEMEDVLKAGTQFAIKRNSPSLVKNMKSVIRHITNLIYLLDRTGDKFLLLYILDEYNIQVFQTDDEVSQDLGYMAFGKCKDVRVDFRLCAKGQRGSLDCYEYRKRKDIYYVYDYEEDCDTTRFSLQQLKDTFDFKLGFTVKEETDDFCRPDLSFTYLATIEFANDYGNFVSDLGKLLDYLNL